MDKWEEIVDRLKKSIAAEEPEAALAAGLQLFAEFGRTIELLAGDMDRLATAAEKLTSLEITGSAGQ
jgi:hypothetical protein